MEKLISDLGKYKPKKESKNLEMKLLRHLKMLLFHCLQNLTIKNRLKKKEEEKKTKDDLKEFIAKINKIDAEGGINRIVFERYFGYKIPTEMLSDLVNSDKKENTDLEASSRNRAEDLINEVLKTDEDEAKKYILNETIAAVEGILEFNEKHQNQKGQGLKILTPQQTLRRLPISLAQLKAGNDSQKLKNKIRQLFHSLYR